MLAGDGSGSGLDADLLDGKDSSQFLGVGGLGRPGHSVNNIDSSGLGLAVTIGSTGLPVMSYFDHNSGDLKFAHCDDILCTVPSVVTIQTGVVGIHTSVAIGSDDNPIISFEYGSMNRLGTVHCFDTLCNSFVVRIQGPGGTDNSITIGSDGLPMCGECVRNRDEAADFDESDLGDGEIDREMDW